MKWCQVHYGRMKRQKKRVNNKMLYVLLLQSSIKLKENVRIENETLLIDSCVLS